MTNNNILFQRAKALKLYGVLAHWDEIAAAEWIDKLITWEEEERAHRGLARRIHIAHLGRFKLLKDFDWDWPKKCDRAAIEDLMTLEFIKSSTNVIFCGPNGVGKSMLARNIAYQAVIHGHTVLFITAGQMLTDLSSQDGGNALSRRIKYYTHPSLVIIDEIGYLSYSNRHADLLFEIISRRYETKATIITTNKPFGEWGEIFPNASCTVSIIDRLVHKSEIINIEADSFRLKEANELSLKRNEARAKKKTKTNKPQPEEQQHD
jgi:DNA replication protein DnaC